MKVEVDPGSVTGTPQELRCGRVLISDSKSFHFSVRVKEHSWDLIGEIVGLTIERYHT